MVFFILLVIVNVWTRIRGNKKLAASVNTSLDAKVAEIETAMAGMRKTLEALSAALTRHGERLELTEKADDRLGQQVHSLEGKIEAAHATYTEILQKAKDREAKAAASQAAVTPGKPDVIDQTKIAIKKEEKPK
jgi:uncharacterized coiled-coil protein SlyX